MATWVWIVVAAAAILVLVLVATFARKSVARRRTARLQDRFGPEYSRVAGETGNRREAETELEARAERHDKLTLRELPEESRDRYVESWRTVQSRFVDDPRGAVGGADIIVESVLRERGYELDGDFDRRTADLSVDHPEVVQRYREGHRLAHTDESDPAATENLREAMQHYRALFDELVGGTAARA